MKEKYLHKLIIAIYFYFAMVFSLSICNDFTKFLIVFCINIMVIFCLYANTNHSKINDLCDIITSKIYTHKAKHIYLISACCFLIIIFGQMVYWFGNYPGGFNLDAYGQWMQAHNDLPLNDWHPVMSTLLIKGCISIFDSFDFYIFVGIFLFALSVTLIIKELLKNGLNQIFGLLIALFCSLSPAIGLNNVCLTKDVQFTVGLNLLFYMLLNIYFTGGSWLKSIKNILCFSVLCTLILLIRHNGIFLIIPLLFLMRILFKDRKKSILIITMITICLTVIIKVPIYSIMNVQPHDNAIGESVGIPMSIMANALINDKEDIPNDVHSFLNEIADDEEWEENYVVGEWDSCKWEFGGTDLLKDVSYYKLLKYTITTAIHCPQTTYESIKVNTQISWDIFHQNDDWIPYVYIEENNYDIESKPILFFRNISDALIKISLIFPLNIITWNTGCQIFIFLLAYALFYKKINLKCLMLFVPIVIFNFCTTLLLAGPNYRYFYHTGVLFLTILLLFFYRQKNAVEETE